MAIRTKSQVVRDLDAIQVGLRGLLLNQGFRCRGRNFNRVTEDGITQVVNLWAAPKDRPGAKYIPGLTKDLYGLSSLNLGIYIPEVDELLSGASYKKPTWIIEPLCCIRRRLTSAYGREGWWPVTPVDQAVMRTQLRLEVEGMRFFELFSPRQKVFHQLQKHDYKGGPADSPAKVVCSMIHLALGHKKEARDLLAAQAVVAKPAHPGHQIYVVELASSLGLGDISC